MHRLPLSKLNQILVGLLLAASVGLALNGGIGDDCRSIGYHKGMHFVCVKVCRKTKKATCQDETVTPYLECSLSASPNKSILAVAAIVLTAGAPAVIQIDGCLATE